MRRREFILLLAAAWPITARGQQPAMPVIGFLGAGSLEVDAFRIAAVRQALANASYVEGRNVAFEYRWADGQSERLPALAAELVLREVALIIAMGGNDSAVAAKAATTKIPIVIAIGGDPIKLGLVTSLNRPGGNVTGVSFLVNALVAKQLEFLHETIPKTDLIGFLVNPTNANAEADQKVIAEAAGSIGQKVVVVPVRTDSELEAAFPALVQQRAGAFVVGADPFFLSRRNKIVELAARHKLPAIYPLSEYAKAGGLMIYGTSITKAFRVVGEYAGRILKGEMPADLPIQQSTNVELIVNLKAAQELGLVIPAHIVARADEVIE
jgi:putative ABC transport system substrate-binding protein